MISCTDKHNIALDRTPEVSNSKSLRHRMSTKKMKTDLKYKFTDWDLKKRNDVTFKSQESSDFSDDLTILTIRVVQVKQNFFHRESKRVDRKGTNLVERSN